MKVGQQKKFPTEELFALATLLPSRGLNVNYVTLLLNFHLLKPSLIIGFSLGFLIKLFEQRTAAKGFELKRATKIQP
jgi:hypothetical protein